MFWTAGFPNKLKFITIILIRKRWLDWHLFVTKLNLLLYFKCKVSFCFRLWSCLLFICGKRDLYNHKQEKRFKKTKLFLTCHLWIACFSNLLLCYSANMKPFVLVGAFLGAALVVFVLFAGCGFFTWRYLLRISFWNKLLLKFLLQK